MERITLANQPKLTDHEVDKHRNQRKVELVPKIEEFIANHPLFNGKDVTITFSHEGISSVVAIIETAEEKCVLKISVQTAVFEGEAEFLNVWEESGVAVPHIIEEGVIGDRSYIMMKFIDAPILNKAYSYEDMLSEGIFREMGERLAKMHTKKTVGYGRLHDGQPEYEEFKTWLRENPDTNKKLLEMKSNGLLNDSEHGSVEQAMDILEAFVATHNESAYCHNDFSPQNTFATKPITVFDPDPILTPPIIDLGRAIVLGISSSGLDDAREEMVQGYYGDLPFDQNVLQASILFNTHTKFPYWSKTGRSGRITKVQEHLKKTKKFLN